MTDDTILPFSFPAVHAKKVTAAFDGGRLSSNGGVMLLAMAERRLGLADNLARVFPDRRDPTRVVHSLVDMFRARMFAICCGYEDADDLDHLRSDPAFKLACGRLPDTGRDLCSQPTLSRLENAPRLRDVIRLTYTLVDAWIDSNLKLPNGRALTGHSHDYKRHGTTTLFAAFAVATGKVQAAHKKRRRRQGFLDFMDEVVATYHKRRLEVILDNLNTHKKNEEWLARHPKVTFHYTPTRASWLNQVEGWFSILDRKSTRLNSS